jgi:molybdenum cofactor cytidylyltransferase
MISAIILAAGQSKRMGQPKLLLPWGDLTVIEHVVTTFLQAGLQDILVVTGGEQSQVEAAIHRFRVRTIHNSDFAAGEMLSSLQQGLKAMPRETQAVLVGLGDQPQAQERSIRLVCEAYWAQKSSLIVPSFQMRRGHPWLVARSLWSELLALPPHQSPRDFLNQHTGEIEYIDAETPSILADLDTPEDYQRFHPTL